MNVAFIRSWIQGVALAAVTGSIVTLLSPGGRMEKGVKTAVSLFMIIMFFVPFFNGNINLSDLELTAESGAQGGESSYAYSAKEALETALIKKTSEILDKNGIKYDDIFINIEVNETENTVDVKSITVVTHSSDLSGVKSLIESETGVPAVIKTEDMR